jgi:hypothetical protein
MGPNATMLGDKAEGSAAASGKAIIASQQGGVIELGDLLDNLRWLDYRVFMAIWSRIRQFWTAQKWILVTDDERNIKWVGMNVPREMLQQMQELNPEAAQRIQGVVSSVQQVGVNIIIDEQPDGVTPALEQFEALVRLKEAGADIPMDMIIEAAPNLRNKQKILERMQGQGPDDGAEAGARNAKRHGRGPRQGSRRRADRGRDRGDPPGGQYRAV